MNVGTDRCGATKTAEMLDEFRTRKAARAPGPSVRTARPADPASAPASAAPIAAGHRAQLGQHDLGPVRRQHPALLADGGPQRLEDPLAGPGDPATDDDPVRGEHVDDVARSRRRGSVAAWSTAATQRSSPSHGAREDRLDGRPPAGVGQGLRLGQRLGAAAVPAAAQRAVEEHGLMADLAGRARSRGGACRR